MEGDLMDEVYGDLSQDNCNTVAAIDDDSMDIYSGLASPRIYPNAERNCTLLSPQNLSSMDLYEEIITEEQQDKDSSYNELRTRYNAAQSQIEELLRRLQQIETKNTTLNTENSRLKKNICALIKTAKMEVVRKDKEINRLSQSFRPERGPAAHHQSQMNCLKNQGPMRLNPMGPYQPEVPTRLNPTGPYQPEVPTRLNHTGPYQPEVPTKLNPTGPYQPEVPTRLNHTGPPPPTQLPGSKGCVVKDLHQLHCQDRDVVLPQPPSDARNFRPPLPVTSRGDSEASVKDTYSSVSSSSKDSVKRHHTRELGLSDKPKQTKHREGRGESPRLSESKEQRHKNSPDVNKESHSDERNRSHRAQKDIGKYDSKSNKSRYPHPSDVEVHRRSDKSKSPHSDILHCTASSYRTSKGLSKDSADILSTGSSRHDKVLSFDKDDDKRSRSIKDISSKNRMHAYSNQASLTKRSSEYFNRKGGTSPPRDHRRKKERKREDEIRKEKNKSGERKSSCTERGKERKEKRTKEHNRCSADVSKDKNMVNGKVREQKTHEESEVLPPEAKVAEKSSKEENGPNRKLSFMETLNLTLSPVKTPRQSAEVKEQEEGTPPDEVPEDQSAEDSGQPHLGELLVVDKIHSSVVDTHEVFENPVIQPASEISKPPQPESMESRHTERESCQDAEKPLSEATEAKERHKCQLEVEDSTVQDGSEGRPELPDAMEGQRTKPTTPEPLRKDFVSAPDCDIVLKTPLESRLEKCDSERKTGTSKDLTAAAVSATTTSVTENCGNNSNTDTGLSANGLTPEHSTGDSLVIITDKSNSETPSALVCKSQAVETVTQDPPAVCVGHPAVEGSPGKQSESLKCTPFVQPKGQQMPASIITNSSLEKNVTEVQDVSKDAVSSTISMEVDIGITSEVITDVTEIPVECEKEKTLVEQSSPLSSIGVSKVSSTTGEVAPSEQYNCGLAETPKKYLNSEPSYTENEEENVEPSSSIPMAHDEDSMMLTLSNLKVIPHAISPLTSPVRLKTKSQQLPCHSKPAYFKSLCKGRAHQSRILLHDSSPYSSLHRLLRHNQSELQ